MSAERVRLAELVTALSLATDQGKGLPEGQAIRTCLLGMRLAVSMDLPADVRRDLYYLSLLRFAGCSATATDLAAAFGDELDVASTYATVDTSDLLSVVRTTFGVFASDRALPTRLARQARMVAMGRRLIREHEIAGSEVAVVLGRQLQLPEGTIAALGQVFERWDGKGNPGRAQGEAIALAVRIEHVCHAAEVLITREGLVDATHMLQAGSGTLYDPTIVSAVCSRLDELAEVLIEQWSVDAVLAAEPKPWIDAAMPTVDVAARALGAFADVKSPYFAGHSDHVATFAADGAVHLGLGTNDVVRLRRAGWVHDVGRAAVSSSIWNCNRRLTDSEWEQVRLHPFHSARVLGGSPVFGDLESLACCHHERLDGSGYHRNLARAQIELPEALLAAADAFAALQEDRPQRKALPRRTAESMLLEDARSGRLDPSAVDAVIGGANGGASVAVRPPTSLSDRELQVVGLVAKGLSARQIAEELALPAATVDAHLDRAFAALGVSTRAAAVFAVSVQGLVRFAMEMTPAATVPGMKVDRPS